MMCRPGLSVISYLYVTVLVVSIDDVPSRVVSHFLRIVVFVDIVPFYPSCNLPLFAFLVCSHVVLPTRLITYHLVCVNIGIVSRVVSHLLRVSCLLMLSILFELYGFLFRSEFFFRTTQELEYIFFCRAKREFFFQNLTLGYMTKTLNQIIFFSSTKIRIFFSATLGIRIFF
jgi:hypothetical protein